MPKNTAQIIERIEKLCKERGISRTQMLRDIKVSTGLISQWENPEKPTSPSNKTLKKIADYFGVTVDYLENGIEEPPNLTVTIKSKQHASKRKIHIRNFRMSGNVSSTKRKTLPSDSVRWKRNIERVNALPDDSRELVLAKIEDLIDKEVNQGR